MEFIIFGTLMIFMITPNSDNYYIEKCWKVGQQKLESKTIEFDQIDNRFYNPSKYIWYKAKNKTKLVQYYNGECF